MEDDFIEETQLKGVFIIKRPTFGDARGFFHEIYRKGDLEKRLGHDFIPLQTNHSRSNKDALRGIHVSPWEKIVTVTRGEVQQVVVDLREDSETFGKYISVNMGDDNRVAVFLPKGCGNAFLVLSDDVDYCYFATDYWSAGVEKYVLYNDPDINIKWQTLSSTVSEKDLQAKPAREVFPNKFQ